MINNIMPNPVTTFNPKMIIPSIMPGAYVHKQASVIGNVVIMNRVNVAPHASIRGDEGTPIFIGKDSNIQDGVVIHGLKDGRVNQNGFNYSVYVGENTSVAHQTQIHGPAKIGNNVFLGMQSLVFNAEIGDNVVVEPAAKVIGVKVAANKYIPAGEVIKTQEQADKLPDITADYMYKEMNPEVVHVNKELAAGYGMAYPANYYLR
ncbi:MAG: carbonate dehydratase [Heliobacteriaceae bacterium]|nr:carbonate dehydratase [Heliobacteriaceae bacterium]